MELFMIAIDLPGQAALLPLTLVPPIIRALMTWLDGAEETDLLAIHH